MTVIETKARDLRVGDILQAKTGDAQYTIQEIVRGMAGPYLILIDQNGEKAEHDTSFDSYSATYSVVVRTP